MVHSGVTRQLNATAVGCKHTVLLALLNPADRPHVLILAAVFSFFFSFSIMSPDCLGAVGAKSRCDSGGSVSGGDADAGG